MFYKLTTNVDLILDLTLHITLPTGQVDCMSDPTVIFFTFHLAIIIKHKKNQCFSRGACVYMYTYALVIIYYMARATQ